MVWTSDERDAAYEIWDGKEVECEHSDPSWGVLECDKCMIGRVLTEVVPMISKRTILELADRFHERAQEFHPSQNGYSDNMLISSALMKAAADA